MSGTIAIVGRPNVGKSALFNRIARKRIAIVHDQPGVTRDRVTAEVEWRGQPFTLIDTGGIGLMRGETAHDVISKAALDQAELAIASASVLLMVVNVQEGLHPLDEEVAKRLRRSGKPVIIVANKSDDDRAELSAPSFSRLGFDRVCPVSAIHGRGMEQLMGWALKHLPPEEPRSRHSGFDALKLAIVGRPNVGKSSIINALTQSSRVIVSPIPGTTRDAVDVPFEVTTEGKSQHYILIDTAGLRKARRVDTSVEFYSVKRTEDSISRCDIAIMVLDAESGILEQDKKVADLIVEAKKGCIVVVNKWDLVEEKVREARLEEIERRRTKSQENADARAANEKMTTLGEFGEWVQEKLFFLDYAPVIFTSAQTGFQLERLLEAVRYVAAQMKQTVPTALLNRTINDAIERRQPVTSEGHFLKFFYATQIKSVPPTFLLFVNRKDVFSPAYTKYLGDQLRKSFGYEGCPVVLDPRPRPKTIESKRRADARNRPKTGKPVRTRRPHGAGNKFKPRPNTSSKSRNPGVFKRSKKPKSK